MTVTHIIVVDENWETPIAVDETLSVSDFVTQFLNEGQSLTSIAVFELKKKSLSVTNIELS